MKTQLGWPGAGRGALAGLLAGAVAVGAGQLVAGLVSPDASPVVAVGQLQIDFTPPWLKNFAIREFGGHDKEILVGGILVVLADLLSRIVVTSSELPIGAFTAVLGVPFFLSLLRRNR